MSMHQQFLQLLEQLTVSDNVPRSAAEKQYEAMKSEPSLLPFIPLSMITVLDDDSVPEYIKKLAAILMRRLVVEEEVSVYRCMDAETQQRFRSGLLSCLRKEQDPTLKARICDIVGDLSGVIMECNEWPEILTYSQSSIQSASSVERETGMALIGMLSGSHASFFASSSNVQSMQSMFCQCLADISNEGRVMLAAIRAFASLLLALPQESDYDNFQSVLASIMSGLLVVIDLVASNQLSDAATIAYTESLIDMADECSAFFCLQLDQVFQSVFDLIERPALQSSVRRMLVEFVVCICTTSYKKVRKMRGPQGEKGYFALKFFPICARMMWGLKDSSDWVTATNTEEEEDADDEDMQDSDMGETALDRVTQALGHRSTFSVISVQLTSLLGSNIWQHQRAGLRIMGNYLEVSSNITDKNQLVQHRIEVSNTLTIFTANSHPQVRAAAFYAVCQMFVMQGRKLPSILTGQLLEIILSGMPMSANPAPRIRRNAVLCLMNLVDSSATSLLEGWAPRILTAVMGALVEGPVMVQECCVSCIVSFAESVKGEQLSSYYDSIMPILQQLLHHAQVTGLEALWGQTMECCAIVGEASGKEKFAVHAFEMMRSLENELGEESEARKYFLKAWVRIARCLGADFLPFLPMVITKLLAAISQEVSFQAGGVDLEELEQRSDIEIIETEDGWLAVRTSAVEEQSTACQLMVLLVEKLQEHFYPYVEETIRTMVPMLDSPHEDVRSYSLVALPEFIRATGKATSPSRVALNTITEYAIGLLITAVEKEGALELIMTALQALKLVLHYGSQDWAEWAALTGPAPVDPPKSTLTAALNLDLPASHTMKRPLGTDEPPAPTPDKSIPFLNAEQMVAIAQSAKIVFRDSIQRRAVLRAEAQVSGAGDEDDVADEQLFMQESLELHYNVAELVGSIFKTHGYLFTPIYLEHWHEMITEMSHHHCLKEDRQFAFFVVSDVIEFGLTTTTAPSYFSGVIPILCEACSSMADAGARQVCAYALGRASELYPTGFAPYALSVLQALGACVAKGEGPGEPRGECTDNAVTSVGVILERIVAGNGANGVGTTGINFEFMWGQWLEYLPLRHDLDEGGKVLLQLARLVGQRHDTLLARGTRLSQAVGVLLNVLDTEYSSQEVSREIVRSLQKLRASAGNPEELVRQLARDLGPDSGRKLEAVLGISTHLSFTMVASSPMSTAPIHDVLLRR